PHSHHPHLLPFPPLRSSDLLDATYPADRKVLADGLRSFVAVPLIFGATVRGLFGFGKRQPGWFDENDREVVEEIAQHVVVAIQQDRKSTRLNSSHGSISYAV